MKFDRVVNQILEQNVMAMDPAHFDYSDPYWKTPEGQAERADREQRYNTMIQGQQQPAQPSPTPNRLPAGQLTWGSPPGPAETNKDLLQLWKKVEDAARSGNRASYDQAGSEYQKKYEEVYPSDFIGKVKKDFNSFISPDQGTTPQQQATTSQQPRMSRTEINKGLQDPNLPNVMKQKYSGKTWEDIRKDPNASQLERDYAAQKQIEREKSLTPQQKAMEQEQGYGSANTMQQASSQQLQPFADSASKRYEQWKQEFSKQYPGTDFSTTDQNIKNLIDTFKTSNTDPSVAQIMGRNLEANIDRVTKFNDNLFKQSGSQQNSQPQQTQLWQSNPGIQQVGGPVSPFNKQGQSYTANYMPNQPSPQAVPPMTPPMGTPVAPVSQLNQQFNSRTDQSRQQSNPDVPWYEKPYNQKSFTATKGY
jgi:hypothetical protein